MQTTPTNSNLCSMVPGEVNSSSTNTLVASTSGVNVQQNNSCQLAEQGSSSTTNVQQQRIGNFSNLRNSSDFGLTSTQQHSRQASASSNNGILLCSIGSPKPEKRQANSPLPPTPKTSTNINLVGGETILSSTGRNSIATDCGGIDETNECSEESPQKKSKNLSPSKDLEGMYAKVNRNIIFL